MILEKSKAMPLRREEKKIKGTRNAPQFTNKKDLKTSALNKMKRSKEIFQKIKENKKLILRGFVTIKKITPSCKCAELIKVSILSSKELKMGKKL